MKDGNAELSNNPYANWIGAYAGEDYQKSAMASTAFFDTLIKDIDIDSPRGQRIQQHFSTATRMEIAFWQQGLDLC